MEEEADERIKEKKLRQLKERVLQKRAEEQRQAEQEMQVESMLRAVLSTEAKERLANVKLVNQELYFKAVQALSYLASSGRLSEKLGENEVKQLLSKLNPKKEIIIKRK